MRKRLKAVPADARPGPAWPEMLRNETVSDRRSKPGVSCRQVSDLPRIEWPSHQNAQCGSLESTEEFV